ncbi:DHH family phosphoesterase [archaeon]|mgnify:CR=1 FL=1|jgi:single-stranded DNA-specific DHH superfamily exonuclease|nr:DHH family phosphoesterase [archaeon]
MLKDKEIGEVREFLDNSQNPIFLFDNDVDGLCSFLILRRALDRGRGVPIKSFPALTEQYTRKIEEFGSDAVVILDKAEITEEFVDAVEELGIPMIWIDHHLSDSAEKLKDRVKLYSTHPEGEPTTYIAQNIFSRQEDEWLALVGCIGDVFKPDFMKRVEMKYPEIVDSRLSAFEALHSSEIGRIVRMLNFGLMDTTTNVVTLIKYMFNARAPHDLLEENPKTRQLHHRYSELNDIYERQVKKAVSEVDESSDVLLFSYSGHVSMSSEIANKLYFLYPKKMVIVAFKKPEKTNISIRGKGALDLTKKIVAEVEGAMGGGHEEATGAMVPVDKWDEFVDLIQGKI